MKFLWKISEVFEKMSAEFKLMKIILKQGVCAVNAYVMLVKKCLLFASHSCSYVVE